MLRSRLRSASRARHVKLRVENVQALSPRLQRRPEKTPVSASLSGHSTVERRVSGEESFRKVLYNE